jgi:hypothetical protein
MVIWSTICQRLHVRVKTISGHSTTRPGWDKIDLLEELPIMQESKSGPQMITFSHIHMLTKLHLKSVTREESMSC